MDCENIVSSYTDYRDGLLPTDEAARIEAHLSTCSACARYGRVVEEGIRQLRELPPVSVGEDFHPRLQHRIYHLEDGEVLFSPGDRGSGVTAMAAVGIAILLTAAAWSPVLRQAHDSVTLPAIVVSEPTATGLRADLRLPPSAFFRASEPWSPSPAGWSPPRDVLLTSSDSWRTSTWSRRAPSLTWSSVSARGASRGAMPSLYQGRLLVLDGGEEGGGARPDQE